MNDKIRKPIDEAHDAYIDWYAAGDWLVVDLETHTLRKRPKLTELADDLGYSRQAIYKWEKTIPNFKERVDKARYGHIVARNGAVWNALFLSAVNGNIKAISTWLTQFEEDFIDPYTAIGKKRHAQRAAATDPETGMLLMEALALARTRRLETPSTE